MPYPPASTPGGYNPYEDEGKAPEPGLPAAHSSPPGYPFGGQVSLPHSQVPHPPAAVYAQPVQAEKNSLGIGALVTGILSILLCVALLPSLPLGILAVLLGWRAQKHFHQGRANNQGVAIAGIVTGSLGAAAGIIGWIFIYLAAIES